MPPLPVAEDFVMGDGFVVACGRSERNGDGRGICGQLVRGKGIRAIARHRNVP